MTVKTPIYLLLFLIPGAFTHLEAQPGANNHYLIFSARGPSFHPFSIGGHAFVSWGKKAPDNAVLVTETYGFYPKIGGSLLAYVSQLEPGRVVQGFKPNSKGQRVKQLVVPVDSLTWERTLCQAEGWNGRAYNLIYNNCVDYIAYVADEAHLKTPNTDNLFGLPRNPVKFIKKLWRKNRRKIAKAPLIRFGSGEVNPGEVLPGTGE